MSNDVDTLKLLPTQPRDEALNDECTRRDSSGVYTHRHLIPPEVKSYYIRDFGYAAQYGVYRNGYQPSVVPDPILLEKTLEVLREPMGGVGFREVLKRRRRNVIAFGLGATALAEPALVPLVDTTYPVD